MKTLGARGGIRGRWHVVALAAGLAMLASLLVPGDSAQAAAKPKAGAVCKVVGAKAKVATTNLKCLKGSNGKLSWTRVTAAGKVIVNRVATTSASKVAVSGSTTALASVVIAPAVPFASETFSVLAALHGPSGYEITPDPQNGGSSEVIYPDPADFEQPNAALPAAVTNLVVSELTETSLKLSFTPVAGVTVPYQVYLRYGDSFTVKGVDPANTVVRFDNLSPGWDYVACAYYIQPVESQKTCTNIHTPGTTPHWQDYLPGPTGVVATAVDNTIEVQWTELADAQRYSVSIEYNTSFQSGGYTEVGGSRTHIRFNAGSVNPGLDYNVRVKALLASGDWTIETLVHVRSNGSQPLPPVKLPAPTNLRVIDVTPTSVTIAWDVPVGSTDVTVWSVVARYQTSFTSIGAFPGDRQFTIPNLNPGYGYHIIVSGYNSNSGIWTNEATTSVLLPSN